MNAGSWYAVWTRSRHEQVVREQIERTVSSPDQIDDEIRELFAALS